MTYDIATAEGTLSNFSSITNDNLEKDECLINVNTTDQGVVSSLCTSQDSHNLANNQQANELP